VKTGLLVALIVARIKGGWEMFAWLVIVLLITCSARLAASFRLFGVVLRLKITSRSAVGYGFDRIVSFFTLIFLLRTSMNSGGMFCSTCA